MDPVSSLPPVIVLGGEANALSIARSLGRRGITVYGINDASSSTRYSRRIRWIPMPETSTVDDWWRALAGPVGERLSGAVLLAASDRAIEFIVSRRVELAARFRLDISDPRAQLCMLDKLCTYQAAAAASIPTPRFWPVVSENDLLAARDELVYPLIVKPRLSHVFEAQFGRKFFVAQSFDEAAIAVAKSHGAGIDVLLLEMIPGPDDRLCSFYTYLDDHGQPLFAFTKRIIRRHPVNMGAATFHVTDHIPELRDPSLALFEQVGLRGIANAEFKLDARDGTLRLIECNARFTASNELLVRAGYDLADWVYRRILGEDPRMPDDYPAGLHLWSPAPDLRAFLVLRAAGKLGWRAWFRSLLHRQAFAIWDWRDPLPSVILHWRMGRNLLAALIRR